MTMKTLLLMRHGKSSWKNTELSDRDRPLSKRGIKASQHMGELLALRELVPQRIFASQAVRALETARILGEECNCSENIVSVDEFYLAEPDKYINFLKTLPDDLERVLVVGHNPGMESLLQILSGQVLSLPTAVIAYLSLPLKKWENLSAETEGELIELWRPKELPEDLFVKGGEKEKEKKQKPKSKKIEEEKPKAKEETSKKKSAKK
jgi:phosphohistidine phosphatase